MTSTHVKGPVKTLVFTLSIALLFSFSTATAAEGFHEDFSQLPLQVQAWESRVFTIFSDKNQIPVGTAFLVHNDGERALYITAAHALDSRISLHAGLEWLSGKPVTDTARLQVLQSGAFEISREGPKLERWKSAPHRDVGYLVTASPPSLPRVNLKNLGSSLRDKFKNSSTIGQKHYVLGTPLLTLRDSKAYANTPIKLRWSEGELIKKDELFTGIFRLYTDADSIKGNSGGPLISSSGELLGVVTGGPHMNRYSPYPTYFTYAVPVDTIKIMLGDLLMRHKLIPASCRRVVH